MNSARCPILTLEVHRRLPIWHRFAWRGENLSFYQASIQKAANICTENDIPSRASCLGPARASFQARKQKIKSP
jgi:hypothetical protein